MEADEKLLENVITGDKSWGFQYDLETKRQSRQWKSVSSSRPKNAHKQRSQVKVILITFFDHQGMVHHEFVPQGQTVNQQFYKEVLTRLVNKICQKQRSPWAGKIWILHHDNAPAHTALSMKQFLSQKNCHVASSTLIARLSPLRFLSSSKAERDSQGDTLPRSQRYQDQRDETPQNHRKEFSQCFKVWSKRMKSASKPMGNIS